MEANNSNNSTLVIPNICLNILCHSVTLEVGLYFSSNVSIFIIYMLNPSKFSNPYYLTMKLMCVSNACLLLIMFIDTLNPDLYYAPVFSFLEEFTGYSQIVTCNLGNCINRFLATVFFFNYKTWVTKNRMLALLTLCFVWNLGASIFHHMTDYGYYSYYDYVRTGTIMVSTNGLYLVSFLVALKRMSSMTGDAKKVLNFTLLSVN